MYILIGLGVLVIAALVVAYLSSKNWHWGQVVLVFFLFLAAVGYSILAADVLRKHNQVRTEYNRVTEELERLTVHNAALLYGTRDAAVHSALASDNIQPVNDELPGIRTLESQLADALRARGPVWRFVYRDGAVNPQTGAVPVVAKPPIGPPPVDEFGQPIQPQGPPRDPLSGLEQGTIVFAFEQTHPEAQPFGRYIGEFQVTQRNGARAALEPVLRQSWNWPPGQQTNERMERIRTSQPPWVLYDIMPTDRYDAFAALSDEQLRQLLPADSVEHYIRHGDPVGEEVDPRFKAPFTKDGTALVEENGRFFIETADESVENSNGGQRVAVDPADVEWRYQRPLRDYSLLFQMIARQRIEKFAEHDALTTDIGLLQAAQKSAEAIEASRQQEIEKLQHDLAGFSKEAEIIQKHAEAVQQQLEQATSELQQREAEADRLAGELAQAQLEATRQLNRTSARTSTVASGS